MALVQDRPADELSPASQCNNPKLFREASSRCDSLASDNELSEFLKSVERRAFKRAVYAVRDDDAALDIVQDAMIRLAEKYSDRPMSELPLLFHRILSNATMDWFRRQKVRRAVVRNFSEFESSADEGEFDLLETLIAQDESQAT